MRMLVCSVDIRMLTSECWHTNVEHSMLSWSLAEVGKSLWWSFGTRPLIEFQVASRWTSSLSWRLRMVCLPDRFKYSNVGTCRSSAQRSWRSVNCQGWNLQKNEIMNRVIFDQLWLALIISDHGWSHLINHTFTNRNAFLLILLLSDRSSQMSLTFDPTRENPEIP